MIRLLLSSLLCLPCFVAIGQFSTESFISTSAVAPRCLFTSDLDGDGDEDVISGSYEDNKVAWYENLGNNEFGKQQVIYSTSTGSGISSVAAGDLDGDGDNDVVAILSTNKVFWFENQGSGNIVWGGMFTISSNPKLCRVFDFDNDGDGDIVIVRQYGIICYESLGGGSFSALTLATSSNIDPRSIEIGNVNGDTLQDFVVTWHDNDEISWYQNFGGGTFGLGQPIANTLDGTKRAYLSDIDSDGDMDVVGYGALNHKVASYINNGLGTFATEQFILNTVSAPSQGTIFCYDINNDGFDDLVTTSSTSYGDTLQWFSNDGMGNYTFQDFVTEDRTSYLDILVSDLDFNGENDIVFCSGGIEPESKVAIYSIDLFGTFQREVCLTAHSPLLYSMTSGDLDSDGLDDLILTYSKGLSWYKNDPIEGLTKRQIITNNYVLHGRSTITSDIDNDGDLDIVLGKGEFSQGEIVWFENNGSAEFTEHFINDSLQRVQSVNVDDIDGDGDIDILCSYSHTTAIGTKWYENNGSGVFGPSHHIGNYGWSYSDDIDGDGDIDIVASIYSAIRCFYNDGLGNFTFSTVLLENGAWIVAPCDIDSDGDQDIVYSNSSTNKIAWIENTGGITWGSPNLVLNAYVESFICTDIDNDGDYDVVYGDWGVGFKWAENLGSGIFGPAQNITSGTWDDLPLEVTTLDIHGDGDMDVVSTGKFDNLAWSQNNYYGNSGLYGRLYVDQNLNSIYDTTDYSVSGLGVLSTPQSDFTYTFSDGRYYMNFSAPTGTYVIQPQNLTYWDIVTTPNSYTINLTSTASSFDSLDFGFYPNVYVNELDVNLVSDAHQCDNIINFWLNIKNTGTSIPSGVVKLTLDDSLSYVSSVIPPDSIIGQDIFWHYDSLLYFDSEMINVKVQTPNFGSIGDTLISTLEATIDSTGTIYNNVDSLLAELTCAYDPNDKIAEPAGFDSLGYIWPSPSYIDYVVRFQNTGNDTALNVKIKDKLDQNLNWTTLMPIASSHPMTTDVDQFGEVTFNFQNIMLPDSSTNETESKGFVEYRIQPISGLVHGDQIQNKAEIYFDFNPPIITNTKIHTLFDCSLPIEGLNFDSTLCVNSWLDLSIVDSIGNSSIYWYLDSTLINVGDSLSLLMGSTGNYNLQVELDNDYCNYSKSFSVDIGEPQFISLSEIHICEGDSAYVFNDYVFSEAIYVDTSLSIYECDSVTHQEVIVDSVDLSVSQIDELTLVANSAGMTYQWIDCDNDLVLVGETSDNFVATQNGSYAVIITNNLCVDTSTCILIDDVGLTDIFNNEIQIIPNPTSGKIKVVFEQENEVHFTLVDICGKIVFEDRIFKSGDEINLSTLEDGIYFISSEDLNLGNYRILKIQ